MPTLDRFDAIVVGAGTAGCVAAGTLSRAGLAVALLDAGPGLPLPPSLRSLDGAEALTEVDRFRPGLRARTGTGIEVAYRSGWGVGGGSAVNTMVATPGDPADYDRWSAMGCPDWSWDGVAPHLERVTGRHRLVDAEPGPLAEAVGAAAADAGFALGARSGQPGAVGFLPATLHADGTAPSSRRWSVVEAELDGAGPALSVLARHPVHRVVTAGGRVRGVELAAGAAVLRADLVVVAAGAADTPLLLRRSGLAGVDVGRAIEDHPSFVFTVALAPAARQPVGVAVPAVSAVLRWGSPGEGGNDLLALIMDHVGVGEEGRRYGAVIVTVTDVEGRGRLDGSNAADLRFEPGWLDHPGDRRRMRRAVSTVAALLERVMAAGVAEAVLVDDRGTPAADLSGWSDDELDRWLVGHPGPISHLGATCRLGGGTLDQWGAVVGVDGVHVVDASVLPHLPNANPNLPILVVADRLAARLT
ncbi:MAG: GMC family oxidoreductase N-terminal domain-containing protein [Acidimicrobiales bacterium]